MSDEFKINAKITADSSNFSKGIKDATNKTKKFSSQLTKVINNLGKSQLTQSLASVSLAAGGLGIAFAGVAKSAKLVSNTIKETTELYRKQERAEVQLLTASKNNPYLNPKSVEALKDFAGEMQNISELGDEEILPAMARLASAGRTQAQIQEIIQAALDISATGLMDFDSAVNQLNSTLNGNIGALGRQIGEIKNLTEADLKNGKAIEIVAEKYKGMSKEVANAVGSSKQLKNAWGDLLEQMGQPIEEKVLVPIRRGITNLITTITDGIKDIKKAGKEAEDEAGKQKRIREGSASTDDVIDGYEERLRQLTVLKNAYMDILNNSEMYSAQEIGNAKLAVQSYTYQIGKLNDLYNVKLKTKKLDEERRQEEEKIANELKTQAEKDAEAAKLKTENEQALKRELESLRLTASLRNEEVSAQDKLNTYIKFTNDLIMNSGGLISEQNSMYQERLKIIRELQRQLQKSEAQIMGEKNRKQYEEDLAFYRDIETQKIDAMIERQKKEKELEEKNLKEIENIRISAVSSLVDTVKQLTNNMSKSFKEGFAEGLVSIQKIFESYKQIVKQMTSVTIAEFSVLLKKYKGDTLSQITLISSFVISRIKKIDDKIKSILKSIVNIFGKTLNGIKSLIKMNISDMLDELLIFEDGILTFFLITLPQLPSYLESVIGSIITLINTIKNSISVEMLTNIFKSMLNSLTTYFPQLLSDMVELILMLGQSIINAVSSWVSEGGFKVLIDAVFDAVISIMTFIRDNLPTIVSTAAQLITDIIVSLCEHLPEIIQLVIDTLIELIPTLIVSVISAVGQIIPALLAMIPDIIEALINAIPDIVVAIIEALPDLIAAIVVAVAEIIPELVTIVPKIIVALCKAFSEAPKKIVETIFNKDAWINAFDKIGDSFTAGWDKVKGGFSKVKDWFKGIFGFATGTNNAPSGLSLVGEQGPELIDLHGGERIYNAKDTKAILTGTGGNNSSNNFNVTFNNTQDTTAYAMIRQLQQYNREMAINGIL